MPTSPQHELESVPSPSSGLSLREGFRALCCSSGVYGLQSRGVIQITGGDRVRWLNGMVTNNIRDLAVGHGVYTFLLNPQGHILGDFYAYNLGDHILVETDRAQLERILATFDHYIIMDDVEVSDVTDRWAGLGLTGPTAHTILTSAGLRLPDLAPLQIADSLWQTHAVKIICGEWPRYPSFQVWSAPELAPTILEALIAAGAAAVGADALEAYRVALGVPAYGQDIRERDLPQETEQSRALNFNKGCYVGQEIVERIRSRGNVHRKFTGFLIDGPPPPAATKIQSLGKDVGEITSSAVVPNSAGDQTVALGYIRREVGTPGKEIQIAESTVRVADLPFADLLAQ